MPIVWSYVTKTYLKIFSLCLFTLFGLSFLIKHKKLAMLIVAGATYKQAFFLTLCMLSITLPHIIGISSFVSSFLTAYKLSSSGEATSLRASGLSFSKIFSPLYFAGAFLLLVNVFLVSELIPYTKLLTNKLYLESQTINPLVLLRKNSLPLLQHVYTEMKLNDTGSESSDVLIAYLPEGEKKISLLLAEKLSYTKKNLEGDHVTFISHLRSEPDMFDHLVIDNQQHISSPESFFVSLMNRTSKAKDLEVFSFQALTKNPLPEAKRELLQRISKILYPFTFTILGLSMALFSRKKLREKDLLFLFLSVFFYFLSFFGIKKSFTPLAIATLLAILPHIFIPLLSFARQKKVLEGAL